MREASSTSRRTRRHSLVVRLVFNGFLCRSRVESCKSVNTRNKALHIRRSRLILRDLGAKNDATAEREEASCDSLSASNPDAEREAKSFSISRPLE